MFQHNFLLIYRTFKRFRSSFFINLVGLSAGLACTLLIYLWVTDELSFDKFHEKDSQLYQVMETQQVGDGTFIKYRTSGLVAETLKEEMPEIEYASSVIQSSWFPKFILSATEDANLKAVGQFVGKDYFNVFSFGLTQGDENQVLSDKNAIVISDELALKLFNTTQNVLGKIISLQLLHIKKQVTVSGIFNRVPANSSEKFDFLLSFEWFKEISPAVLEWGNDGTNAYVVVKKGTNLSQLNDKIAGLIKSKRQGAERALFLKPYSEAYLYGRYENGVQSGGRYRVCKTVFHHCHFHPHHSLHQLHEFIHRKSNQKDKRSGHKKSNGSKSKNAYFPIYRRVYVDDFFIISPGNPHCSAPSSSI